MFFVARIKLNKPEAADGIPTGVAFNFVSGTIRSHRERVVIQDAPARILRSIEVEGLIGHEVCMVAKVSSVGPRRC